MLAADAGSFNALASGWSEARGSGPVHVIDTHTGGNPTRIIVGGVVPPDPVRTVPDTRAWLRDHADWLRTRLIHEPRGGGLTCAVLPLPATDETHDIGAVILEPGSYPPMCGHCMIGLSIVVDEFGLISPRDRRPDPGRLTVATPAGLVHCEIERRPGRPTLVNLTNVDSFVVDSWIQQLDGREVRLDLVYGGDNYATVDARELGLPLDRRHAGEIVRLANELIARLHQRGIVDPITGQPLDVYQVMFHAPVDEEGHSSRVVVVAPPGVIDRSPCGTGSSALLALQIQRGELRANQRLETRSIIDSTFSVVAGSTRVHDGRTVVSPRLTGTAHVTGFSTVVADPSDPLADGFPPI